MNKPKAMKTEQKNRSKAIDDYIALWPEAVRLKMDQTRSLIHETVPEVSEQISWSMPTFQWRGKNLCHFAGHKQHLGFYPGPAAIVAHAKALEGYKTSKGAIQFPYSDELPIDLMKKIIVYAKTDLEKLTQKDQD